MVREKRRRTEKKTENRTGCNLNELIRTKEKKKLMIDDRCACSFFFIQHMQAEEQETTTYLFQSNVHYLPYSSLGFNSNSSIGFPIFIRWIFRHIRSIYEFDIRKRQQFNNYPANQRSVPTDSDSKFKQSDDIRFW